MFIDYPLKCPICGSLDIEDKIIDTLDGHTILEMEVICNNCKKDIAYWAYGHWDKEMNNEN